jgi:thioredoxin-related protein
MKYWSYLVLFAIPATVWAFSARGLHRNYRKPAAPVGIQFRVSSWAAAVEEARKENKPIFLDAYASWCGPCKLLKRNTFTKKEAGDFFNEHFVNIAIDMEKGEGPELADKFSVDAYPTLIIADKDGNLVTYTKGYMNAGQLVEFGRYGLNKFHQ